jgi:hypothetical protein
MKLTLFFSTLLTAYLAKAAPSGAADMKVKALFCSAHTCSLMLFQVRDVDLDVEMLSSHDAVWVRQEVGFLWSLDHLSH